MATKPKGPLDAIAGVKRVNDFGRYKELRMAEGADPQAILRELAALTDIEHFEIARPSLHDIFVRIAGPEAARADGLTEEEA